MEQIIFDISIAETYSTQAKDNTHIGGLKDMDSLGRFYKDVFAHHNITAEEFGESLKWYKAHPDQLDSIYTHISARADKMLSDESRVRKN